ncbi:MAG: Endopolyphosphatase [Alyxoria varia]|nr:MAG: Endopolyphosphatase [Alyxoria varia]
MRFTTYGGFLLLWLLFPPIIASQIPFLLPVIQDALEGQNEKQPSSKRELKGKFLHITDLHPDPFYKAHADADSESCHRHKGPAGYYGAEATDCDSPYTLVNATFDWVAQNLKHNIDFVIWTGDSARHDNDEKIPRSEGQVLDQNAYLANKMLDVFGTDSKEDPKHERGTPVVPTFGNNDILPHNIFRKGPNRWTKHFAALWRRFIPEEQRHQFEQGGWFFVEVIPNKLAVFSLNTMYFYGSNAAVDGCYDKHQPGFKHFEWLRIQLQFLRERGMKAIMSGHVPPARTEEKTGWDETCWQKYALWMQQYRDVVVGSVYGHMNIDHFFLQDFRNIDFKVMGGEGSGSDSDDDETDIDEEVGIMSGPDYLKSLRQIWSKYPEAPGGGSLTTQKKKKKGKRARQKFFKEVGGEWAERFSLSLVSASVVPNFYPSLRVVEYNISGLEDGSSTRQDDIPAPLLRHEEPDAATLWDSFVSVLVPWSLQDTLYDILSIPSNPIDILEKKKHKKHRKHKHKHKHKHPKKKKPHFHTPSPPSETSPPGPAYSPQTLSWIGYTQYYANLTLINNDDYEGKRKEKDGRDKLLKPKEFTYEVEYDTRDEDDAFGLAPFNDTLDEDRKKGKHHHHHPGGLLVRNMVQLAARIGKKSSSSASCSNLLPVEHHDDDSDNDDSVASLPPLVDTKLDTTDDLASSSSEIQDLSVNIQKHKKHKKHKKKKKKKHHHHHKKKGKINKTWLAFVSRAFVGTLDEEELWDEFG